MVELCWGFSIDIKGLVSCSVLFFDLEFNKLLTSKFNLRAQFFSQPSAADRAVVKKKEQTQIVS